ncbi:2-amino-4-hydroxy-6-hydroxymethyldihydropteridine diphosphokinase [Heyndrickxia acidicola]|uniref:2-amino-4-hydroxy-6-hydroxymethyldihydropteridine diphosphokinase n=1 Tax=Heyndrickxia acidicola TaxID=209389 RepID=A0ABU6MPT4_9BACI|nr:2-amino-4-hydroxy-6-hydroxymethyldihydropteridine diphosphokinase [Heyndrickxia acidicola]MED1205986.1 2-amino-4-hydroxy-6-hydroxymethyldihydropteridine diphosphokinase [Heyndrickxia acidicola]
MNKAYLSLGSNIGNRNEFLERAIEELVKIKEIKVTALSSIYETDPVGYTDQAPFLNMAVELETSLTTNDLLDACLKIESESGRKREIKWGPRTLDLDILLYNNENIEADNLIIPHPRMHERAFVLIPLLEINRTLWHPLMDAPLTRVLDEIDDKEGVRLWRQINGEDASALFEN